MRERRIVSILFSDLSGFTRLSERMDPEDVADTVDALFHRFRAAIESLGGTVDKFIGDAVMAVFGAPAAHADDPARAIRAGIALQRELASFNREKGIALAMRVGVNTGEVLWGSVGGSAATAMGDTVNVAQRLEGAARPGTVLVSSSTHDAAQRLFRFEPRGEVALKGREGAVQTFEAVEELSGQTEHVEAGRGAHMVGRDAELEDLQRRLATGRGAFLLLEGTAGVGKSRLLAELRARVRRSGRSAWVAVGRAYEGVRAPLGPMVEILRAETGVTGSSPEDGRRIAAAVAAGLEALEGTAAEREDAASLLALSIGVSVPGARTADLEPAKAAVEITGAWAQWIRAHARRGPVLICIEDLHWSDAGTRALLAHLATRLSRENVAIVATSRPGPPPPAGFERIPVGDLSQEASARLAASLLGAQSTPELAREVVDRAGGHPYFLEELARAVRARGADPGAKPLPDSLLGLLVSRLDEQPPAVREALKAASAFGRAFWPVLVAEAAGVAPAEPFEEALRRELVMVQPSSLVPGERQLAFRHALLRDAAYSLLPRKDRQRLHTAAAAALEARASTGGRKLLAMSAEQLRLAGDEGGAAARWESAAIQAETAGAVGEIAEYAMAALSLRFTIPAALAAGRALSAFTRYPEVLEVCAQAKAQPGILPRDRLAFDFLAAAAEQGTGHYEEAFRRMSEVPVDALEPVDRVRVSLSRLSSLHLLNRWGDVDAGLPVTERQLEALHGQIPEKTWCELRANAWNMHGIRSWHKGNGSDALEHYGRAAEFSRASGIVLGQAACEHNRAMVLIAMNRYHEAIEACDRSMKLRLDAGYRQRIGTTLVQRSHANAALGRDGEARVDLVEALRLHRAAGDIPSESVALATLAELDASTGRREGGLEAVEEVLALDRGSAPENHATILLRCSNILLACGESARALEFALEALAIRERVGAPRIVGITLRTVGRLETELRMFAEAEAHLDRAAQMFEATGDVLNRIRTFASSAETRVARGNFGGAAEAARRGLDLARGVTPAAELLDLYRVAGEVAAARGRLAEALSHFETSVVLARDLDLPPELVLALTLKARALLDLGRDREAEEAAGEALGLARERGRPRHEAAAEIILGEIEASRRRTDEAVAAFRRAAAPGPRKRPSIETVRARTLTARFLDLSGLPGAAEELSAAELEAAGIRDPLGLLLAVSTKARIESRAGRAPEAIRLLSTLPGICPLARVAFRDRLRLMSDEARIRHEAGEPEAARTIAEDALRQAREVGAALQAGHFEQLLQELK